MYVEAGLRMRDVGTAYAAASAFFVYFLTFSRSPARYGATTSFNFDFT